MPYPKYWTKDRLDKLKILYDSGLSMREVGKEFGKSIWAINSIMKNNNIPCRKRNETNKLRFLKSPPSFYEKKILNNTEKLLKIAGLMLYWGEGAKKNTHSVDFANSDPTMILVFIKFLRTIYQVNESKFRIYLYSYGSLPTDELIQYWSQITHIPSTQFTKPYIRAKSDLKHDKMQFGLIHIRYSDIRLLKLIIDEIKQFAMYC